MSDVDQTGDVVEGAEEHIVPGVPETTPEAPAEGMPAEPAEGGEEPAGEMM
ncbi:MAG: hypothetical protein WDN67_03740 [Candidatus Moraniibacteriota bacterium]